MGSAIRLRSVSVAVLFFALSSTLMLPVPATGNQEILVSTLSKAEKSMAQACEAVLNAERVGADVSGLLVRLNDGAALLSQSHMSFEVGDFDEATRFAESASEFGHEVVDEAELLKTEANDAQVRRSWRSLTASALGISTVIVASLVGYQYFKRRYYRRLSETKSRVGRP